MREGVPGSGATAMASPLPSPVSPGAADFSLSGSWVVDNSRSESLEPFLAALNVPAVARRAAMELVVCDNVLHTSKTLTLVLRSAVFVSCTHLWLDGYARDKVGEDGKAAIVRAWQVRPGFRPPPDAPVPLDPQGVVPGTIIYVVDLPDSMGSTMEYRWRDGDSMIVRSEVYSASGELRVVVTRVWVRAEAGHPLAIPTLSAPLDSDQPPPTVRITNPIGHAVHAARMPAGPGPLPLLPTLSPHSFVSMPLVKNYSGRWRMTPESVITFTQLMKAAKVPWQAFKGPLESSLIVQTPTHFALRGPSSTLHPAALLLVNGRSQETQATNKKRVFVSVTQSTRGDQELVVDMVTTAPPGFPPSPMLSPRSPGGSGTVGSPMSDGGASPATGLRVVDVFTLRDRATLVRNTSVYKDGVRVGAAQGAYELLETDDERSAMDLCVARRAEFQASLAARRQVIEDEFTGRRRAIAGVLTSSEKAMLAAHARHPHHWAPLTPSPAPLPPPAVGV